MITIIEFYATWCSPCKTQKNIIEKLENKYKEKINFKYIDVDINKIIADKYKIMMMPTTIIEKDEIIIKKYIGIISYKLLKEDIENILG